MTKPKVKRVNTPHTKLKVFIIDDIPLHLQMLRRELEPEFDVVGEAGGLTGIEASLIAARPDLLIADLNLGGGDTFCVEPTFNLLCKITHYTEIYGDIRIIVYSQELGKEGYIYRAIRSGALGLVNVHKNPPIWRDILLAVHGVELDAYGVSYKDQIAGLKSMQWPWTLYERIVTCSDNATKALLIATIQSKVLLHDWVDLTPRDRLVLSLRGKGKSEKEIAAKLNVSEATIGQVIGTLTEKAKSDFPKDFPEPKTASGKKSWKVSIVAVYTKVLKNGFLIPI